jgi:hypothetical protein
MAPKGRFNRFDAFTKTVEDGQFFNVPLNDESNQHIQPAYEQLLAAS